MIPVGTMVTGRTRDGRRWTAVVGPSGKLIHKVVGGGKPAKSQSRGRSGGDQDDDSDPVQDAERDNAPALMALGNAYFEHTPGDALPWSVWIKDQRVGEGRTARAAIAAAKIAKRSPRPPASARYVTDEDPADEFTWADFEEANREGLDPADLNDVAALRKGQSVTLGGGASATTTITRTR